MKTITFVILILATTSMKDAGLTGTKPATEYFDPSLYLATV